MTTKNWNGTAGSFTDSASWSPTGTPQSGDIAVIAAGTVLASGLTLAGLGIQVQSSASAGGTFQLANSTLSAGSVLTVTNQNAYATGANPNIAVQGTSTNSGTINFNGSVTFVQFGTGSGSVGTLVNNGLIALNDGSPQFQPASGSSTPVVTNNGTIAVTNPDNVFQSPVFNATINGTGTITVGTNGKLDLAGSVGSGQTLTFTGGVGANSVVQVDAPASFNPTLSQFVSGDTITVTNTPYTGATYTSTGSQSGVLTLYNGGTATGALNFSGVYSLGTFSFSYTQLDSTHSTLAIKTSVVNASTGATGVGAVYRFFDNTNGTHFFTSDSGERNTVSSTLASRYTQETNNFGDVAPTDASAAPVYRFFDKIYGTHFFTASASERDTIQATRSDLTYEPSSTFYEHAAQQSGDVAVYRFFDTQFGTHFYTGSASEYAGLTTPGTATFRANLTYEGVGFYAPAGSFT